MGTKKYFQLNKNIVIRQWANKDCRLLNINNGKTVPVSPIVLDVLNIADGSVSATSILLCDIYKQILEELVSVNMGAYYDSPQVPIDLQKLRSTKARRVDMVHWSITGRCNLRCRHCFVDCPTSAFGELPLEQMIKILDQFVDANVPALSITGGEVFVRRDCFELFSEIKKRNLCIKTIYTNGEVLSNKLLDKLDALGIKADFSLSYDGTNGCHDWIRNRIGVEKNTLRAINTLIERGIEVEVETAVYKDNLKELIPTYNLLKELGVSRWKLSPMVDSGAWLAYSKTHSANNKDLYDAYLNLIDVFNDSDRALDIQLGGAFCAQKTSDAIPYDKTESKSDLVCPCMYKVPYLLPNGKLLPCIPMASTFIEKDMPNLLEVALEDILSTSTWSEIASMKVSDLKKSSKCGDCDFWKKCKGGCRASAIASEGSIYGSDKDACSFWKSGYYEKFNSKKKNEK